MTNFKEEANADESATGAKNPMTRERLKEYGKEAFTPMVNLLFKYQDQLAPYLNSIVKGLDAAARELRQETSSTEDNYIGNYFNDASRSLEGVVTKLNEKDVEKMNEFIKEQSDKHPGVMFGSSYVIGLVCSRIVRQSKKSKKQEILQ